ncbi:MAG: carbonic anhydrase [Planctomycetaceae bacterium]
MAGPIANHTFESPLAFDPNRIGAAAVYCSDGRFGEHLDDFLHRELRLPRYDRLAVPGGAACLAGHFNTYREEEGVVSQLRFLLEVHRIERLVLIAHDDCGYYTEWLKISPLQLETRQREDMLKAIRRVQRFGFPLDVSAYFARLRRNRVQFEQVSA